MIKKPRRIGMMTEIRDFASWLTSVYSPYLIAGYLEIGPQRPYECVVRMKPSMSIPVYEDIRIEFKLDGDDMLNCHLSCKLRDSNEATRNMRTDDIREAYGWVYSAFRDLNDFKMKPESRVTDEDIKGMIDALY